MLGIGPSWGRRAHRLALPPIADFFLALVPIIYPALTGHLLFVAQLDVEAVDSVLSPEGLTASGEGAAEKHNIVVKSSVYCVPSHSQKSRNA